MMLDVPKSVQQLSARDKTLLRGDYYWVFCFLPLAPALPLPFNLQSSVFPPSEKDSSYSFVIIVEFLTILFVIAHLSMDSRDSGSLLAVR